VTTAGGLTLDLANGVNVANNFFLENNFVSNVNSGTATISGTISEATASSLTKTGSGTLILGGNNTYTGLTNIQAGDLEVSGSITSNVQVANPQSTLSGAGTVGSITNNGVVQPGNNGIGNLTVNGDFTQNSGGTTQILVNSSGNTPGVNNGELTISGQASLAGALRIQAVGGGNYTSGTQYTFLNATNGVSGQYSTTTTNLSLYTVNVTYDPNDVVFELIRTGSLVNSATTNNQVAVSNALQNISLTSTGGLFTMINTLGSESAGQQQQAYNQLSGEQYGDTQTLGLQVGDMFQQRIVNRIYTSGIFLGGASSNSSATDSNGGWMQGYGMTGKLFSDNNGAGVSYSQGGAVYGADLASDESGMIGIAGGNSYVGYHDGFSGGGQLTSYQIGLYAMKQNEMAYVLGSANYAYDNFGSNRNVLIGGVNQTLTGNYVGHQLGANLETGLKIDAHWVQIQPLIGLQYLYLAQQGFDESGGSAALNVSAAQASSLRSNLGARFISRPIVGRYGAVWTPYGQTRYVAELLDNDRIINASFNGSPIGGTFTTAGTKIGTNYGAFTKGVQVQFNDQWSMFAGIDIFLGTRIHTETGSLGACYNW
jgi:subtilase-type serine protease